MSVTSFDLSAIWLEAEPQASEAYQRLAANHGERFADLARDTILADKHLAFQMEFIDDRR